MATEQDFCDVQSKVLHYLEKGKLDEAQEKLGELFSLDVKNHLALSELGWLFFQRGKLDSAIQLLVRALNQQPDNANYHFQLGIVYWQAGNGMRLKAVEQFILSVKFNPSNADAYRYLGHYYATFSQDKQRASKCYQKCISLNPDDSEAGEALCRILDSSGQETLELAICHEASQRSPRAFWAWRQMGYIQAQQKKWENAVGSLQHAIRGYPTCADLWEALGHSYQQLGMLTAALKAYSRATSLEAKLHIFSFIESGNILISLGSYKKAIEQFQQALECAPHNLAAEYGLASALTGWSKDCVGLGAFGWASKLLKEAAAVACDASQAFGNIAAVWKLLGDIQVLQTHCLPWEMVDFDLRDHCQVFQDSVSSWKHERTKAAIHARNAYAHALHLCPWQANLYKDLAVSIELINHVDPKSSWQNSWCLSEVMALGALVLESFNTEFWITLGCMSRQKGIQQHSFIRALHLDGSHAPAWAYLGKLYVKEGRQDLAGQAFDRARSANPLLPLPWAGMSASDNHQGAKALKEAFSNCLYAVQLMPIAEFQLGLGKLATVTGQLQLSKVFVALDQAAKRAPHWSEAHNLKGLAWESRGSYSSAIHCYRRALYALQFFGQQSRSGYQYDVSLNLARVLCKAGRAKEAIMECEILDRAGGLDGKGLQIYAVALWLRDNKDLALSIARKAVNVSEPSSACVALGLLFRLTYHVLGPVFTMTKLLEFTKYIEADFQFSLIGFAIAVLDKSGKLPLFLSQNSKCLFMHERAPMLYYLLALGELLKGDETYRTENSCFCLRKALHMYPQSFLLRKELGQCLLSTGEWKSPHVAVRCLGSDITLGIQASTSRIEILGAANLACSSVGYDSSNALYSSCGNQKASAVHVVRELQRRCHLEPWDYALWYLLVLNLFQNARNERYPVHLCRAIKKLLACLRWELFSAAPAPISSYKKIQLCICASEIFLQIGEYDPSIKYALCALDHSNSSSMVFLAHLQLARCYASKQDWKSLYQEYNQCLQLDTRCQVNVLVLCLLESKFNVQVPNRSAKIYLKQLLNEREISRGFWASLDYLMHAQSFVWKGDLVSAENVIAKACSTWPEERLLHLIHGAICLELARRFATSNLLMKASQSLGHAQNKTTSVLPYVSLMLAQTEASLGRGKSKWEDNIRLEWSSWRTGSMPAEVLFQMHLLCTPKSLNTINKSKPQPETVKSSRTWLLRALHLNPSCQRYWEALKQKFLY